LILPLLLAGLTLHDFYFTGCSLPFGGQFETCGPDAWIGALASTLFFLAIPVLHFWYKRK
jgi:hypothetical protein